MKTELRVEYAAKIVSRGQSYSSIASISTLNALLKDVEPVKYQPCLTFFKDDFEKEI